MQHLCSVFFTSWRFHGAAYNGEVKSRCSKNFGLLATSFSFLKSFLFHMAQW